MIPSDKFFVTHTTSSFKLQSILENRAIQPLSLRKKLYELKNPDKVFDYEYNSDFYEQAKDKEKYVNSIFYGFVYPDETGNIEYKPMDLSVHFIFSSKIISDNATMYGCRGVNDLPIFCKGWNYGAIDKNCYYYDCKESLEENVNKWRNIALQGSNSFNPWTGTYMNEILLEGEMPLDMDLIGIYTNSKYSKDTIEKLKEEYPEYNWIHKESELLKILKKEIPENIVKFEKEKSKIKKIKEDSRPSLSKFFK